MENEKVIYMKDNVADTTLMMQKSYERMLMAQSNFSNIAVARAIEIAKENGINLNDSHILGVSFAPQFAIVSVLYQPTILLNPQDTGEPKQVNIPVPAECLWPTDDSWKEIYMQRLEESNKAINEAKQSGEMQKAFAGDETIQ